MSSKTTFRHCLYLFSVSKCEKKLEVVVVTTALATLLAESRLALLLSVGYPMLHHCTKLCANIVI